jgi:putative ABC transport system permease protein
VIDRTSLRVALRTLGRHRGFTIVAVTSLAIAIALNTTMYSVLDAMLAPRINAHAPDRVFSFHLWSTTGKLPPADVVGGAVRAGLEGAIDVTGHNHGGRFRFLAEPLAENGPYYRRVTPFYVWPNYFEFLGTRPLEGRTFAPNEDASAAPAVISDDLARRLFPGQSAVGQSMTIDGNGYTVIGVVARALSFRPLAGDVWMLRPPAAAPIQPSLIRLARTAEKAGVEQQLSIVAARIALSVGQASGTTRFSGVGTVYTPMKIMAVHYAMVGAVIAVLLVACANLANLQLARGLTRVRELALRAAVGASRRQLVGHLMLESGLLAFCGLVLGLVATLWGAHVVRATLPPEVTGMLLEPQTSWRMFAFATVAAICCMFIAGLIPALRLSRVDPETLLKSGAGTGANREHRRRYGVMVMAQIGLALPVLIGGFVLLKATMTIEDASSWIGRYGYNSAPLVVSSVWLRRDSTTGARVGVADIAPELVSRARAVSGILDAAVYLEAEPEKRRVTVDDGFGAVREVPAPQWQYDIVSPSYFRTFGRRIEKGRDFTEGEFDGSSLIISQSTAQFLWGSRNPIGRSIKLGHMDSQKPWHRVVGVIGDPRDTVSIRRADPTFGYRMGEVVRVITPQDSAGGRFNLARLTLYARASGSTRLAAVRLQRGLRSAKVQTLQAPSVLPLDEQYGRHVRLAQQRFLTALFGVFGWIAISLVAIGVYGIVAHSIAERRHEIAVRISLGASSRNVLHAVLREGNVMVLSGVAIGLLLTRDSVWWLIKFMADEDAGYDAFLMALVASMLFAIAVLAALFPAWRATRIDPVEALRHE